MQIDHHDNRARWIIIGGAMGATAGVHSHHLAITLALGVAAGMMIGSVMNRILQHR